MRFLLTFTLENLLSYLRSYTGTTVWILSKTLSFVVGAANNRGISLRTKHQEFGFVLVCKNSEDRQLVQFMNHILATPVCV